MKKLFAITLIASCVLLSSCRYAWTYKMLPSENYEQPDLKGWIFSPDIQHEKHLKPGDDSILVRAQHFSASLRFKLPNKKEVETLYDISVEGVSIKYFDLDIDKTLSVSDSYYYSSPHNKQMSKKINLVPTNARIKTNIGRRTLFIPLEVDSALLTFDAVLRKGKYSTYIEETPLQYEHDDIIVFDGVEPIRVPISLVLHKKTTKMGYVALSPGH